MIDIKQLTFGYTANRNVLNNITLSLDGGHIHGLLGCNGIGKSTLLKIICGLMRPTGGSVCVAGVDPSTRRVDMMQQMMIIPEEFSLPSVSLISYARMTSPFYPQFSMEQMNYYCGEMMVDPHEKLHNMSMGQRKKAYIAFAMACNTRILLLDEPTNGLDIPSKSVFRRLLAGYTDESRCIVVSTHQVNDIDSLLDNIIILDQAGVALEATTAEICRRLSFGAVDAAEAVYTERSVMGQIGVAPNTTGEDSRLNLELLFNAVTADRGSIARLIK
ncbi:MAG: ABC transporter ATP-binding protein [Alistipes sp.]|nr:ABC transporter ATP-binding protein [Alistipes sp.]MDE6861464.1 ABC transporter ATP-binding protein [Alistipes sp.]MDE7130128.1 ABC transporter ATP-binding protein [Alistipes sp.]